MCGLVGFCDTSGTPMSGEVAICAMATQRDRGNGLGAGYAGYGIYPEFPEHYAIHMMLDSQDAKETCDLFIDQTFDVDRSEPIPTRPTIGISDSPILWRYFVKVNPINLEKSGLSEEDFVVDAVMHINRHIHGAFVASSGKNMGVFKGIGFPEEIGYFYRLDEYAGHTWTAHNRFPTNTPGRWHGAHPFALLDFSIVHNGELSSYGINSRYVEQFGYTCTMGTDTEVAAYLFDLLLRRHNLPVSVACKALAAPLWSDIDRMEPEEKELATALRSVYGPGMLNGPFAMVLGSADGMVAFNDRIKLRPLVAAVKGTLVAVGSEESSLREVIENPDAVWAPKAGEPVIARIGEPMSIPVDLEVA